MRTSSLSLNYAKIQPISSLLPKRSDLSIRLIPNNNRDNTSFCNSGISFRSQVSVSPKTTKPLSLPKFRHQLFDDKLVRLNISQLYRQHISENYMNKSKKLDFNANRRNFVSRVVIV